MRYVNDLDTMMRTILTALLISAATPALAASIHNYGGLALSPDGATTASIEDHGSADHDAIVLRAASDGHVLRTIDPCDKCAYSGLAFGRNGALAFLVRDRSAGTVSLIVDQGKASHTVATIAGIAQMPRFAPDGRHIALLVTIGARKESGATQAGVRAVGEIGETNDEQRIAVFDLSQTVAAADVKPVSPADRYVYEYDWTPDGKSFVATSALGNGDNNWWIATLDAIDARTGTVRQIAQPSTQLNFPRVSPDGKTVAYIGGLMSDFGSVGGDVWTVPLAGGTPTDITPGYPGTFTSLAWTNGGLRASVLQDDQMGGVALMADGKAKLLFGAPAGFAAGEGRIAWSADGASLATVEQDFEHAPAIHAGAATAPRQITHDNDGAAAIVRARSVEWTNEGFKVQGWLLAPRDADPSKKAAMITIVHGGPAAANTPGFVSRGSTVDYIKAGYYVFLPNPRGSYGQGEKFTAANKRDFGGGDLRDILTGIDAVEKVAPVDDARLGLTGGSYGGFMAMWTNTQTDRFKALVAGAGLSDWISYYGTNGIDQWMLPYFGKSIYDDPAPYHAASAVDFAKKAHTPTFIYVGERDIEVPPTQSVEWWHALKEMNVPVSLVIYPDEGHGLRDPEHSADATRRTLAWFAKYLGPNK
jgi:dipeptidyl aminopeptidase/acylaminoacyl peptidase